MYYLIANTLHACGELKTVNKEDKIILAKATILDFNMTPNLGAMLLR
jgi:hypothetical protein